MIRKCPVDKYIQSPLKANVKPITKFSIKENNMKFWLTDSLATQIMKGRKITVYLFLKNTLKQMFMRFIYLGVDKVFCHINTTDGLYAKQNNLIFIK